MRAHTRMERHMRGQRRTLTGFLRDLPESVVAVRVRIGTAKKLRTVSLVAVADHADAWADGELAVTVAEDRADLGDVVELTVGDNGWPTDVATCRLDTFDSRKRAGPSWQQTARTGPDTASGAGRGEEAFLVMAEALRGVVSENCRMMAEARRMLGTLGESLAHREEVTADLMEAAIKAAQDRNDAEAALLAQGVEHLIERGSAEDPLKERAVELLGDLGGFLLGGQGAGIDADGVAEYLDSNPAAARSMAQDPRIVAAFARAMREERDREDPTDA